MLSIFGSILVAMPFLLDLMQVPADTFDLYVVISQVMNARFGALVAALHVMVLAIVGACAMQGLARLRLRRLGRFALVSVVLIVAPLLATRLLFEYIIPQEYKAYQTFVQTDLLSTPVPARMVELAGVAPRPVSTTEDIVRRGVLRVGYRRDALPFVFRNEAGNLVGLDIDAAHMLAVDLGVELEFVLLEREEIVAALSGGQCDIVMAAIPVTPELGRRVGLSDPYLDLTFAFVVRAHRRDEFNSRRALQRLEDPRIAIPDVPYYVAKAGEYLPDATLITVASPREFFRQEEGQFDALVYSAEAGSAWTLVYPQYGVAIPYPDVFKIPLAYAMAADNVRLREFVNTWLELKRRDGSLDRLYQHWILGKSPERSVPRWSVIRDVLGWVE